MAGTKVVFWPRLGLARAEVIAALEGVAGAEVAIAETLPDALAALHGARGLVTFDAPAADASRVMDALAAPGVGTRWLHLLSAGREGYEAAGFRPGVAVTSAAGAVAPAVAEHAMTLLLSLARRVPEMVVQTGEGRWDRALAGRAVSLEGMTLALIGLGHIGREIARRARGFGMRIEAVTRTVRDEPLVDAVRGMDAFAEVTARADAIVVAAALAPETRHLFDAAAFARLRAGSLFVNISRGGLVDQDALREALASGRLGGAGLDVTDPEPLPAGDPLWSAPNLIVSPHFAGGGSRASLGRLASGAADNLRRLLAGRELQNRVAW